MSTIESWDNQFLREVVLRSSVAILCLDTAGSIVFSNEVLERQLGYGSGELIDTHVGSICSTQYTEPFERIQDLVDADPASQESLFSVEVVDSDGVPVPVTLTAESLSYEDNRYFVLWIRRHATETEDARTDRSGSSDRVYTQTDDVNDELSRAQTPEEIARLTLAAARRRLDSSLGCVRLFDESAESLERVATSERATDWIAAKPTFDLDASLAGRAYRRGEPVIDDDGISIPDSPDGPTEASRMTGIHLPLGTQGTLTLYAATVSERTVDDLDRLASVATAHLERLTRTDEAAANARTAEWLDTLAGEITDELTRDDAETTLLDHVCERLTGLERYTGAWYLEADPEAGWGAIETSAGDVEEPPPVVREIAAGQSTSDPVETALQTDQITLVRQRQQVRTDASDAGAIESDETEALVPVRYGERTYGVLVLTITGDGEPGDSRALRVLQRLLGLAVYTEYTQQLLLSERALELEFEVTDRSCLAVGVSDAAECYCEVEHATTTKDGQHLMFLSVEDASLEEARRAAAALDPVVEVRVIEETESGCRLEVIKSESGAEAMMDVGATVSAATAENGRGTLVVEAPLSSDVREIVEAYTDRNPGSKLVAKREIDRRPGDGARRQITSELTERQYSVLIAAYHAGYYDWPRESTAEELANSLGISSATLHQHLRKAERKMIKLHSTEEGTPPETL